MNTIKVTSAAEYEQATKMDGKNKIEMDYFDDLSDGDVINIRHESGYEIWQDGEVISACSSSAPVYCVNQYGTTDNRAKYGYPIDNEPTRPAKGGKQLSLQGSSSSDPH